MSESSRRRATRSSALILVATLLAGLLLVGPSAGALHRGCVAIGAATADECTFISSGGRILAVAEGTSYVVTVIHPNGTYLVCLDDAYVPGVNICSTTPGSTVYVFVRVGVASARTYPV